MPSVMCAIRGSIVRRLMIIAAMGLLVTWIPATSLCLAENAGLITSTGCCDDSLSTDSSPCCKLAAASYKAEDNYRVTAMLLLAEFITPVRLQRWDFGSSSNRQIHADVSPPELCHTWQFCIRAAASPRAPSSAS